MFNYTAFDGFKLISQGTLEEVALAIKRYIKKNPENTILIFSDTSGKQKDLDLSGSEKDVIERLKVFKTLESSAAPVGPGRPKIGVKAREISLLPSHWEWLSNQPGGASATIRNLVNEKMKAGSPKEKIRQTQDSVYAFLNAIAGNLPNFDEVIRYLYRKDRKKFEALISDWPKDIVKHTLTLSQSIFESER